MNAPCIALLLLAAAAQAPAVPQDGVGGQSQGTLEMPLDRIPIEELSGEARVEALKLLHARLEQEYFLTADRNGNGWISFREGAAQLRMDRTDFFRFDGDADGRITRAEFGARYRSSVATVGSFRPPTSQKKLFETAAGSPLLYDFNDTGALEAGELDAFLADKGIAVPVQPLLEFLDKDRSRALEPAEFQAIIATLTPLLPKDRPTTVPLTTAPPDLGTAAARPSTVFELFGARTPRPELLGGVPMPDAIAGPILHFQRLDYDRDGFLDQGDLAALLRPAYTEVRGSAVLAALDRDGDGRLSEAEFRACLGDARR
jgi:Ca2+-binding EF-hand superfamily protein